MSTETSMRCSRHPNVETALTCASCGTPICPKCMVTTPVGMKCRDCGTSRGTELFKVRPERFVLAGITALIAGVIAGFIGEIAGFFVFFIAAGYGYFAGTIILKASGMKRGTKLEILAGAGMVIGGLALKLMPIAGILATGHAAVALRVLFDPFFWIVLVISTGCAVSKIRYI